LIGLIEKAQSYYAVIDRVLNLVKPERDKVTRAARRERWWQHAERATGLYNSIHPLKRCFIAAATTKYLNFSAATTNYVFLNTLYIFTTDRWDLYAVIQSTLHEVWARKRSGALGATLRYSPSDCFITFPFPSDLWQTPNLLLADIGERYHEYRRALMSQLWIGLTDIYNLFPHPRSHPGTRRQSQQENAGRSRSSLCRHN
jgi:hypothetical protein